MKIQYVDFEKVKYEDSIVWESPKWLRQQHLRVVQVLKWDWERDKGLRCLCLLESDERVVSVLEMR